MKVIFESATVADAIAKAARVAPSKSGEAFDKASGILMSLDGESGEVILRATNLDVFYLQAVDTVELEGDGEWLFPSGPISEVMATLPMTSGSQVILESDGGYVKMVCGRTKAKFRFRDSEYYPTWEPYDPDLLDVVPDLGARIQQVEWAASNDHQVAFSGIHMDGESVMATDRFRLALAPCEASKQIYKPITIPAGILKPVIANLRDVAVGIDEGMFLLMPDPYTQIKTRIYDKEYPNLQRVLDRELPNSVSFKKQDLLDIIRRAMVFGKNDRMPEMMLFIGKGEISVMCSDEDIGLLGDTIVVSGQCDHRLHKIKLTPRNLTDCLNACPSETVELNYDLGNNEVPLFIDGGSGFRAMIMPRKDSAAKQEAPGAGS